MPSASEASKSSSSSATDEFEAFGAALDASGGAEVGLLVESGFLLKEARTSIHLSVLSCEKP